MASRCRRFDAVDAKLLEGSEFAVDARALEAAEADDAREGPRFRPDSDEEGDGTHGARGYGGDGSGEFRPKKRAKKSGPRRPRASREARPKARKLHLASEIAVRRAQ